MSLGAHRMPAAFTLLIACLLAAPAAAQQVDVQLREERSRAPIIGAIVRLLGEFDTVVLAQGLSNEGGRISLRAPAAGRYRLKVDRIGWVGLITPSFALGAGQTFSTEVLLADVRMDLPTIEVQGQNVCGRRFDGDTEAANLWQEIDRALTATIISQREAGTLLHVRGFRRELLPDGRPHREWFTSSTVVRGQAYRTLPPELLAAEGFVLIDQGSDSTTYAVPDAALLVSPEFTMTHCFRTVRERDGRLGLAFEPAPGRSLPDIRGTLWLDPESHELRSLEFSYVGIPPLPRRVELGGQVDFKRLPNGRWTVSDWYVRTPMVSRITTRTPSFRGIPSGTTAVDRLTGLVEMGGRVAIATDARAVMHHAVLVGRVADPTTGGGLAGATVTVDGVPGPATTDSGGWFALTTRLHGEHRASVQHPRFRIGGRSATQSVLLSIGDTTVVDFNAPTIAEVVRALCGNPGNRTGIVGMVVDSSGTPIPGVQVRALWPTPTREIRQEWVRTSRDGAFEFCNLTPDVPIVLTITDRAMVLWREEVQLAPRRFEWLELRAGGGIR